MAVLLQEEGFDLASAYLAKAASQNVRYVEICFDPQAHPSRGVTVDTVLRGPWLPRLSKARYLAEVEAFGC